MHSSMYCISMYCNVLYCIIIKIIIILIIILQCIVGRSKTVKKLLNEWYLLTSNSTSAKEGINSGVYYRAVWNNEVEGTIETSRNTEMF